MAVPVVDTKTTWRDRPPSRASADRARFHAGCRRGSCDGAEGARRAADLQRDRERRRSAATDAPRCCRMRRCSSSTTAAPTAPRNGPRRSATSWAVSRLCAARGSRALAPRTAPGSARAWPTDYDVMIEMDADMSHDPAVLPELLRAIDDGADLVIGSRYVPGGSIPEWPPAAAGDLADRVRVRTHDAAGSGDATRRPASGPTVPPPWPPSTSTTSGPTATAFRWKWPTGCTSWVGGSPKSPSSSATGPWVGRRCRCES